MKKIKSHKLSLNKQTVTNLNAVKGGLLQPTNTYCNGGICTTGCNNNTFQQTACGTCPTYNCATNHCTGRVSCDCDSERDM